MWGEIKICLKWVKIRSFKARKLWILNCSIVVIKTCSTHSFKVLFLLEILVNIKLSRYSDDDPEGWKHTKRENMQYKAYIFAIFIREYSIWQKEKQKKFKQRMLIIYVNRL